MYRRLLLATFFVVVTAASLSAQTNLSFELKRDINPVYNAGGIVQGDFNRDGKPDLVIGGGSQPAGLTLRLGNGDGTFQAPVTVGVVNGSTILDLAAADLNHDGKLDLVVVDISGSFDVLYGNGDGTFQPPLAFDTTRSPRTAAVGDFNGDGLLDVAVGDVGGNIEIFNNTGDDFVLANTINLGTGSTPDVLKVRSGNVDGNGIVDLGVLTYTAAYVLWGDGHGNFTPVMLKAYASPADLNVGDLNQDGIADIVISYSCNTESGPKGELSTCAGFDVFYGQGNERIFYRHAVTDNGVESANQPWAVDVNGDGIGDIAALTNDSGFQDGLYVWLGHPDGSFDQTPQRYIVTTDRDKTGLVPGDWNRDGMIDFAQALPSAAQTEIYINGGNRAPCTTSQINPAVTVCQPVDNTYSTSPIRVQANAYDKTPVTALQEYVDNQLVYSQDVSSFNITLPESLGPHSLVTKAWDAKGISFRSNRNITVYSGTPGPACPAAVGAASICLPPGATSHSPVHILANGYSPTVPTAAQLYIDGKLVINDNTATSYVDTYQNLSNGTHSVTFKEWDANGNALTADKTITVN